MTPQEERRARAEEWLAWRPGQEFPAWAEADFQHVADMLAGDLVDALDECERVSQQYMPIIAALAIYGKRANLGALVEKARSLNLRGMNGGD